ncbi:MAG: methyltransferase domain-containing protein [Deferribacterales bacterium]
MKIHIRRAFCSSSDTYDSSCDIQRIVADHLAEKLPEVNGSVLEIGTGTGIFTEHLNKKYADQSIYCIDIAHSLLKKAQKTYSKNIYICGDGEHLPFNRGFSLVAGSSCLQWFQNPEKSIPAMLSGADRFVFSVFVDGTFAEMKILNEMTGFGSVYPLPKQNDLLKCFGGFAIEHEVREYVIYFDSVQEFLKKQKGTGATFSGSGKVSSKTAYKRFLELYPELFGDGGKIPVTYRILYITGFTS